MGRWGRVGWGREVNSAMPAALFRGRCSYGNSLNAKAMFSPFFKANFGLSTLILKFPTLISNQTVLESEAIASKSSRFNFLFLGLFFFSRLRVVPTGLTVM